MPTIHVGFPSPTIASLNMSARPALARLCEELGFETMWHSNERFYREMFVCMSVSSMSTTTLGIGGAVADPFAVHPVLTAQSLATVDELSGGRASLGLAAGGSGFPMIGIKRDKPAVALREAVTVIRRLLQGETVTFDGKIIKTNMARLHFTPKRQVPLWVASRGDKVLETAGEVADGAIIATYGNAQGVSHALSLVETGAKRAGRSLADLRLMSRVDTCVHADPKLAYEGARPMVAKFLWISYPDRGFVREAGLEVPAELEALIARREYDLMHHVSEMVPDEFVDAFCWSGTPQRVAEQIIDIGKKCGIREFGVWVLCAPDQTREEALRLIAEEVVPRVKKALA